MNSKTSKLNRCPYCGMYSSKCANVNSLMRAFARGVCSRKHKGVKLYEEIEDPWNDTPAP